MGSSASGFVSTCTAGSCFFGTSGFRVGGFWSKVKALGFQVRGGVSWVESIGFGM